MILIRLKPDVFAVTLAPGHILYWPLKYPHQCSSVQLIGDKILQMCLFFLSVHYNASRKHDPRKQKEGIKRPIKET